jgi:hypothetical protein
MFRLLSRLFKKNAVDTNQEEMEFLKTETSVFETSIDALSFCLEDMLRNKETTNEQIRHSICFDPSLVTQAQDYTRYLLGAQEFEHLSEEVKEDKIACEWPRFTREALLIRNGALKEDLPLNDVTAALGEKASEYRSGLMGLEKSFNKLLLTTMKHKPGEMPLALTLEAVQYARSNENFIQDEPFSKWFPRAIKKLPLETIQEHIDEANLEDNVPTAFQ